MEEHLLLGGDGRYFMSDAIKVIIQMAAANKVSFMCFDVTE